MHLVIGEEEFVALFRDAVEKGVFHEPTLEQLRTILSHRQDPLLDVIGTIQDGQLTSKIDDDLYGEKPR